MVARSGAMHVARNKRTYVAKSGERRVYESVLVRRTYREAGKVRHETLANLSALPAEAVTAIEATLKGERLVPAGQAVAITASLPHGHVAAVAAMAGRLGLPVLLGPACRQRDLALALIVSRVVRPGSKLSTAGWWDDTTLGADLGVAGAGTEAAARQGGASQPQYRRGTERDEHHPGGERGRAGRQQRGRAQQVPGDEGADGNPPEHGVQQGAVRCVAGAPLGDAGQRELTGKRRAERHAHGRDAR